MLRISICDTSIKDIESIKQIIEETLQAIPHNITTYQTTTALLFAYHTNVNLDDLIIIDHMQNSPNGIQLANQLRQNNYQGDIIFLTNNETQVFNAFDSKPITYLRKQSNYQSKLKQALLQANTNNQTRHQEAIILQDNRETHWILKANIMYIESLGRKIKVVTNTNKSYISCKTLKSIQTQLNEQQYIKVHKSYLINLNYIHSLSTNTITMQNNDQIPIGRNYLKYVHSLAKNLST